MRVKSCEHWRVHSFKRRWTLLVRPIFRRIAPGLWRVGWDVRALRSRAVWSASLTRRLRVVLGAGSRDEATSADGGPDRVVVVGVTQNM